MSQWWNIFAQYSLHYGHVTNVNERSVSKYMYDILA